MLGIREIAVFFFMFLVALFSAHQLLVKDFYFSHRLFGTILFASLVVGGVSKIFDMFGSCKMREDESLASCLTF